MSSRSARPWGTWGAPALIPGSAALPEPFDPILSCPSPGNCTLGGDYFSNRGRQLFVASEKNGTWAGPGLFPTSPP